MSILASFYNVKYCFKVKGAQLFFNVLLCVFLSACAGPTEVVLGEPKSAWDFDHNLQFKTTQFDEHHYRVEVIAKNEARFERLAAFLLRKSYLICEGEYGFTLTFIKGVKSFDFKRATPNLILPNLTADLECPVH